MIAFSNKELFELYSEHVKSFEKTYNFQFFCKELLKCPCIFNSRMLLNKKYESENKFRKKVDAREIWNAILTSQIETGTPYLLYKDKCNQKCYDVGADTPHVLLNGHPLD